MREEGFHSARRIRRLVFRFCISFLQEKQVGFLIPILRITSSWQNWHGKGPYRILIERVFDFLADKLCEIISRVILKDENRPLFRAFDGGLRVGDYGSGVHLFYGATMRSSQGHCTPLSRTFLGLSTDFLRYLFRISTAVTSMSSPVFSTSFNAARRAALSKKNRVRNSSSSVA